MKIDKLLYIHRVAIILDCPRPMIYKLIYEGKLKAVRIGKRGLRISTSSLKNYMEKNTIIPDKFHLELDDFES
jgi:excisionase family DNA binding protein